MRRIVGIILAGLGAFFIVLAAMFRLYVPSQLVKYPLDEYQVAVLQADNGRYFSAAKLKELSGISVTTTYTLQGDVAASSSNVAVWNNFTAVHDDTNNVDFNYTLLRAAFDRRNGLAVNCCGAALDHKLVHMSGQVFVWPFNAQKKSYMLFDTTLARAMPVTYAGTATVHGLKTYRYVENVAPTQSGTQTLPGSLVGLRAQPSVTLPEYYQTTNTYLVDPVTGGPVSVEQNETLTLRDPNTGATRLVLFQADLKFNDKSTRSFVDNDVKNKNKVEQITVTLPLILLLAGLVLLGVGIAVVVTAPVGHDDFDDDQRAEQADHGFAPHYDQ